MRTCRLVALASAIGFAAVACAREVGAPTDRRLAWAGCSDAERVTAARAFDRASRWAARAAAAVGDAENQRRLRAGEWDAYRWWFGAFAPERFADVRRTLRAARARFDGPITVRCGVRTADCPAPPVAARPLPRRSRDRDAYGPASRGTREAARAWKELAYASYGVPAVQLCGDFFSATREDQAGVLLHELTHVSSDTADYAYRERDALALARRRPDRAVRNAQSYAGFARGLARGLPPRSLRAPPHMYD